MQPPGPAETHWRDALLQQHSRTCAPRARRTQADGARQPEDRRSCSHALLMLLLRGRADRLVQFGHSHAAGGCHSTHHVAGPGCCTAWTSEALDQH